MYNNVIVFKKINNNYPKTRELILSNHPDAAIMDVTADGLMAMLDPGYPVRKLRVPGMDRERGLSLRGIWEGLKVFSRKDARDSSWWHDERKLKKTREFKSYGKLLGLRIGDEVVGLERAKEIFEEMYRKLLKERFDGALENIREASSERVVFLVDYTDGDPRKLIDHAEIIRSLVVGEEIGQQSAA